jgi:1-acyl-sn-glycerol-3-phosphate acyltransferase
VPVALNSGKIWPKNSFLKYPGDIHITFLEPIEPGIEKNTFVKILEEKIYSEMEKHS